MSYKIIETNVNRTNDSSVYETTSIVEDLITSDKITFSFKVNILESKINLENRFKFEFDIYINKEQEIKDKSDIIKTKMEDYEFTL